MIGIILSALDILTGSSMLYNISFLFGYLIYLNLAKGIWSVITSFAAGYYFDWMGIMDVIAGGIILLWMKGIILSFFPTIGVIMIAKGIYSITRYLLKF